MVCHNPDAILGVTVVDLTTLLTVAGLFLSVVVGNAAIFGDSLFASIAVPKTLEATGLGVSEFLCARLGQSHPPLGERL